MIGKLSERPLAAPGFVSYRARSLHGWIMIGALSDQDALIEAKRSNSKARHCDLQVWSGDRYVELHSMDRDAILRSGQDSAGFGPQAARGKEVRP